MAPRSVVTMAMSLLCVALSTLSPPASAYGPRNYACCVRYTRNPQDVDLIIGYVEQRAVEVCRIEAIIFYIKPNRKVCADPNAGWVKRILKQLSAKLEEMSGKRAAALGRGRSQTTSLPSSPSSNSTSSNSTRSNSTRSNSTRSNSTL
uniref:C-C motif chemokine ligand 20-like 2 n=1 Tax=Plecoglossus altivelis TaxID=61084 RepID=A0A860FQW3_PLEAT|nr:C-C motif chemokine ligand 20-like 2 [Plecoglossus altivelis]